jgi:hypothetical protein
MAVECTLRQECQEVRLRWAFYDFFITNYQGKVPAVASCATCQRKFFTPSYLYRAPFAAQEYLLGRYDLHDCPGDPKKRAPLVAWQQTEG